jgi:hypothetical protein
MTSARLPEARLWKTLNPHLPMQYSRHGKHPMLLIPQFASQDGKLVQQIGQAPLSAT